MFCCVLATAFAGNTDSQAKWITVADEKANEANTWISFRKDVNISKVPKKANVQIAVDSKYWLWVNGELVVFEGGLKRGPTPKDTYYDEVDLAPYLSEGTNKIAVLVWFFGKDGFSHKNSGKAGLIIKSDIEALNTNATWVGKIHPAFGNTDAPHPNYRLSESNIRFDANKDIADWQTADCQSDFGFASVAEIGEWGSAPWNNLVKRPIPFWKDYGVKEAQFERRSAGAESDSVIAYLPYNMQMTPILDLGDDKGGNLVKIYTDHTFAGGETNVRAEYITKQGQQTYESLGWMNGQHIILIVPKSVTVNSVQYRETGYDAEATGLFSCDDEFYMRFWEKGLRTLYVNMRDTYFDCPDRERAQWWGDVVVLMGESFYTYSPSAHALMKKAIHELAYWQKEDGKLYSPVPSGNHNQELPAQMLASIGRYGFWNYYMNTGDKETIADVYPIVKKYLSLWSLEGNGLTAERRGEWDWGDWGNNIDLRLIYAGWHYLALEGAANMASVLGYEDDAQSYRRTMAQLKEGYNQCWNGTAYRHPDYKLETDDRAQALAVISGIADESKYADILKLFKTQMHASPYMEKYVMEALFVMGQGEYAMERTRTRFTPMVNNEEYTTLFEGWGIGKDGYGGGTVNHAWSGGAITVISQYLCGIYPMEAAYKTFRINPVPASFKKAFIAVPTVSGEITSGFAEDDEAFVLVFDVPEGTKAVVNLPTTNIDNVMVNDRKLDVKQVDNRAEWYVYDKTTCVFDKGEYVVYIKKGK